jgi:hypothetical protein
MILFRPVGLQELQLIADTNFRAFPPRLPDQPIFYPVLNFEYARQIAEGWNTRYNNPPCGFITRFEIEDEYAKQFSVETVGARENQELWIPAESLKEFNANIIGKIKIEAAYYGTNFNGEIDPQTNLPSSLNLQQNSR